MKRFILLFMITTLFYSCKDRLSIYIQPGYEGWVYMIKSNDKEIRDTLSPDSNGVVYVPFKQYDKSTAQIVYNGIIINDIPFNFYNVEYYTSNNNSKIQYCKFYYPLTTDLKDDKIYDWNDSRLPEFDYYYASGILDRFRLFRFDK